MSQLDEIHAMCRQILARLGEAPAVTAGVTYDADETPFLPGTGRLGGSGAHQPDDDGTGRPDDPAERARILERVRSERTTTERTEVDA